jgi:hypothetical protein
MLTLALLAVAVTSITGAVVLVYSLVDAPEGFEDQAGFQVVWRNNRPDAKDVVCIWGPAHPTA